MKADYGILKMKQHFDHFLLNVCLYKAMDTYYEQYL